MQLCVTKRATWASLATLSSKVGRSARRCLVRGRRAMILSQGGAGRMHTCQLAATWSARAISALGQKEHSCIFLCNLLFLNRKSRGIPNRSVEKKTSNLFVLVITINISITRRKLRLPRFSTVPESQHPGAEYLIKLSWYWHFLEQISLSCLKYFSPSCPRMPPLPFGHIPTTLKGHILQAGCYLPAASPTWWSRHCAHLPPAVGQELPPTLSSAQCFHNR